MSAVSGDDGKHKDEEVRKINCRKEVEELEEGGRCMVIHSIKIHKIKLIKDFLDK